MSSAAVALYTESGKVLIVKANYKSYWAFPGGVIDAGETPRIAAARETQEEVGISIDAADLSFCLVVDRMSHIAQTYQFIFEVCVTEEVLRSITLDLREMEDWAIVTREDIIAGDRKYSQSTRLWAQGYKGYKEQEFGKSLQQDI